MENITLYKHCLWDILHVEWDERKDPLQGQKYPPKRTPECPPERQNQTQMDPEEKLPSNVHGKAG